MINLLEKDSSLDNILVTARLNEFLQMNEEYHTNNEKDGFKTFELGGRICWVEEGFIYEMPFANQ